jgi:hypothetical protein
MQYLTHQQFKKMLLSSWKKIAENKEEIDKINVFPVPDMDTGTNLEKTLKGIKEVIEKREFENLEDLSKAVLEGALTAAQGNAGVIFTGFLAGFLPQLDKNPLNAQKLAKAMKAGAKRARESIQNPKEGTILDVIDAASKSIEENSKRTSDILNLFREAIRKAQDALLATREKMEIFKKANVVDAGGLGFLMILESYLEALEGEKLKEKVEKPSEKIRSFIQTISYRYEVVFLITDLKINKEELRERLTKLGNSLEVVQIENKVKVHIHTDDPDKVVEIARESGKILDLRIEDMAKEISGEESVRKISIGIVTEDVAALLPKILEKYQIELAHTILDWPEMEKFPGENLYQKIREAWKTGTKTLPKTSQAPPIEYLNAFKKQLQKFEKILCITLTSKLSGCYNSACQAKEMLPKEQKERIYILDSLSAAAGQSLLVLRAIELIQEQREISEILDELKKLVSQTHLYLIFEDPKGIESIGRISKSQANWIRRMKKIGLHPIMELKNGIMEKGGIVFAKEMSEALFKKVLKESKKKRNRVKKLER